MPQALTHGGTAPFTSPSIVLTWLWFASWWRTMTTPPATTSLDSTLCLSAVSAQVCAQTVLAGWRIRIFICWSRCHSLLQATVTSDCWSWMVRAFHPRHSSSTLRSASVRAVPPEPQPNHRPSLQPRNPDPGHIWTNPVKYWPLSP